MKHLSQLLLLSASVLLIASLPSCNNDDDSGSAPPSITYPHTISYSYIENVDFRMWTNGAEVNTEGLDFISFVDTTNEIISSLLPYHYQSAAPITFTIDSVFSSNSEGAVEGHPYFISNDSVYFVIENPFNPGLELNVFIGLGSTNHLRLVQGYSRFCGLSNNTTICHGHLETMFYSFDVASEIFNIDDLSDIDENDTLIIKNQYVHYQ